MVNDVLPCCCMHVSLRCLSFMKNLRIYGVWLLLVGSADIFDHSEVTVVRLAPTTETTVVRGMGRLGAPLLNNSGVRFTQGGRISKHETSRNDVSS